MKKRGFGTVIRLTRFNESEFVVNADLIEFVEATPDTVVTLTTGKKFLVREPIDVVVKRVVEYRQLTRHSLVSGKESAGRV